MIAPLPIPSNRELVVLGGAALVAGVAAYVLVKNLPTIAPALARGAASTVLDTGAAAVKGVGDSFGLPDPADPKVHAQGVAALARGDYMEASQKLPALEFLSGVASKLGAAVGLAPSGGLIKDDYVGDFDTSSGTQNVTGDASGGGVSLTPEYDWASGRALPTVL